MKRPRPRRPARHAHVRAEAFGRLGKLLDAYLRDRARVEGFEYDLSPDFFVAGLQHGYRSFFGIEICSHAKLLRDDQEPSAGYFDRWMTAHGPARCTKAHPAPPKPTMDQLSKHWRAAADNFTDDALLAKWDMVGERMATEEPGQFAHVLKLFGGSADATARLATLHQWQQLGRALVEGDRRTLAELAISSHIFLDRDKKRTSEDSRTEPP